MSKSEHLISLPQGWSVAAISEVADYFRGVSYQKSEAASTPAEGRIPVLRANNLGTGFDLQDLVYVPSACVAYDQVVRANDIVLAMSSGSKKHVGKSVLAIKDMECAFGAFCGLLRPRAANLAKFISLQLEGRSFRRYIEKSALGTNINNLKSSDLLAYEIVLAPENEQRRIVAKIEELFSELDKGVESLTTVREQLKAYRQSVLNRAVVGELAGSRAFPSKPLSAVVEELGQGWSPRCLNHPAANDETWAVITTTAIQHSVFQEQENKQLPEELEPRPHLAIRTGDILITRAGPRKRVGVACLVRQCRPRLMLCDKAYRLRADTGQVFPEWLELVLNSPSILQKIEGLKTGISDSGVNLTQTRFLDLEVPVPSLVEQTAVLARVDSLTSQMTNLETQIEIAMHQSEALRQSTLRRAFSGQLVARDPADEPASALLERIRAGGEQVQIRARKRGGARA